jgi:hypothetical protein
VSTDDTTKYCCDNLKETIEDHELYTFRISPQWELELWDKASGDITIDYTDDNRVIKFCPFCGKRISFKHPENYDD